MGFGKQQNSVSDCVPEFGAIFMLNNATKEECFKRKLFGLPYGMANFVKQVKVGMILFLFEFEKRELHGVFVASSDGTMNIVPHAFISSGKQFPAQVKFTLLWRCSPLCEDEFYDAIKDNYFSKNKFNFGLSKDQVHKLLSLFSLRKLKVQPHHKVPSCSTSKPGRVADDGRSIMNNQLKDKRNASCHRGSVILNEYFVDSPVSVGRTTDGGRTVTIAGERKEYKMDSCSGKVISKDYFEESLHQVERDINDCRFSTNYPEYSLDNEVRRVPNDVRFAKLDMLEVDNNGDNGYEAAVSTMYPGSFHPSSNTAAYTHNSDILQADCFGHNQLRPFSPLRRSMGPQVSNLSHFTPSGNASVTSTCPYDPDPPGINYWPSSSSEVNHSLNLLPVSDPSYNSNVGHIFPSVGNQSLLSCVEPVGTRYLDVNSDFDYSVPMPLSEKHHEYPGRTNRPFFGAPYSETVGNNLSKNEGSRGVSFLEPSFTPGPFSECGNSDGMNEDPSCSYSPSIYPPFLIDYGYHLTSQEKREHEAFAGNVPTLKQSRSQSQGHLYPIEFESIDHHDSYSLKSGVYRSSRNMYLHHQKKRTSVFSRLGASKMHMEENDTLDDNNKDAMDTSADEIMSMLHQSQYQGMKMSNHTQLTKGNTNNSRKQKQTTCKSELLTMRKISKKMVRNGTADCEDNDEQFAATTSFVDFKRRSEVRKSHDDDTKISGCNENAEKSESGGLRRRLKLIRPNFNKNELPDVKSIDTSEKVEPHLLCQLSREDKCTEAERVSNCSGEELVETCGAPFKNADENGKELSQKFSFKIMQLSVSPEANSHIAEEVLIIKDSVMDGVSQDLKNHDQAAGLESSLETHEKNTKGITASEKVDKWFQDLNNSNQSVGQDLSLETCQINATVSISSKTECCRGNEKELYNFDKVYPLDGEIKTNIVNCSSNQNPKLEKAAEDLRGNGNKGCELDFKQNVENGNEVLSSSGETTIVGCKAISSNLY